LNESARRPGIAVALKRHWHRAHAWGAVDFVLCLILIALAIELPKAKPFGWGPEAVATLVGALAGAAALLLGNWINRLNDARRITAEAERKQAEAANRVVKVKALVTARLVAVALKLIHTKKVADAALTSRASPQAEAFLESLPESTGLLRDLGSELLELDSADLDALETLDTNLEICGASLRQTATVSFLRMPIIVEVLGSTMIVLAQCFDRIAPHRLFKMDGKQPEQASVILRQRAKTPSDKRSPAVSLTERFGDDSQS
jgi:hypothetical protein